jgi:hypothetical protein
LEILGKQNNYPAWGFQEVIDFEKDSCLYLDTIETVRSSIMIQKKILEPERIRRIDGGFSFIPHRFLTDGFWASLDQKELLLYLFLVLVSDRYGLSFYSYETICSLLELSLDQYMEARDGLAKRNLIAFDGTIFQVLELPCAPIQLKAPEMRADITKLIRQSLKEAAGGR